MAKQNNTKSEPIEKQLWAAADKFCKNINAAEYKHIALGLMFIYCLPKKGKKNWRDVTYMSPKENQPIRSLSLTG